MQPFNCIIIILVYVVKMKLVQNDHACSALTNHYRYLVSNLS